MSLNPTSVILGTSWESSNDGRPLLKTLGERNVHSDVTALLNAGILERSETGAIVFPFDAVQVEFTLRAA